VIINNDNIKAIAQAITSLRGNAEYTMSASDEGIKWLDTTQTQPTDSEITAEIQRLQDIYDSQEYARNRKAEYDKLNQFEMQFDDQLNGTTTWVDAISAIKQEFPK
jgi:hypothetical protein